MIYISCKRSIWRKKKVHKITAIFRCYPRLKYTEQIKRYNSISITWTTSKTCWQRTGEKVHSCRWYYKIWMAGFHENTHIHSYINKQIHTILYQTNGFMVTWGGNSLCSQKSATVCSSQEYIDSWLITVTSYIGLRFNKKKMWEFIISRPLGLVFTSIIQQPR